MTDITEQVILQIRNTHYQIPVSVEFIVNMTIKEIEKRIDNQINQLEEFKEISSKSKIKEYDIAIKYLKGFKELYLKQ